MEEEEEEIPQKKRTKITGKTGEERRVSGLITSISASVRLPVMFLLLLCFFHNILPDFFLEPPPISFSFLFFIGHNSKKPNKCGKVVVVEIPSLGLDPTRNDGL